MKETNTHTTPVMVLSHNECLLRLSVLRTAQPSCLSRKKGGERGPVQDISRDDEVVMFFGSNLLNNNLVVSQ